MSTFTISEKWSPWLGASWKLFAFACYAGLNAIAHYLSGGASNSAHHMPINHIVFYQDLFAFLMILPWFLKHKHQPLLIRWWPLHAARVLISALAVIFWYFALYFLPISDAVALSFIGPVFGVLLAQWLLKEQMSKTKLLILFVFFAIGWYVLRPDLAFTHHQANLTGLYFVLLSALGFAVAKICTRQLILKGESAETLSLYLIALMVPVTFLFAFKTLALPTLQELPWLMAAGGLTALAIYAVSKAFSYAQVTFLAPFDMFRYILNASIGFFIFTEIPALWGVWMLLGMLCVSAVRLFGKRTVKLH